MALVICLGLVAAACTGAERAESPKEPPTEPSPTPVEIRRAQDYMVSVPGSTYVRTPRLVSRRLRKDFKRFPLLSSALRNLAVRTVIRKRTPSALVVAVILDEELAKEPRTRTELFEAMGVKKVPTMIGFRIAGEHVSTAQLPFGFGAVSWQDGRAFVLVMSPRAVEANRVLEALIRGRGTGSEPLSKNPFRAEDPETLFGAQPEFTFTTTPAEIKAGLEKDLNRRKTARVLHGWASRMVLHGGAPIGIVTSLSVRPPLVAIPKFRNLVIRVAFGRKGRETRFGGRPGMETTRQRWWGGTFWRGSLLVVVAGQIEFRRELRNLANLLARA